MQVLIINGSPRKNGVTAAVLHRIEENLRGAGIEVLFYNLGEVKMSHCTGCNSCYRTGHCYMEDDAELLSKRIEEVDGIVLGSPTYASNVSGLMKDFIDRGHFVMEQLLHKKYCIAVASGENYGSQDTLKVLKNLVLFSGGRLSGQLRIQAGFNELEGMIRKRKGQIDQVSQNLIMAMKGKQYYPIQSIVHFFIFHLGIKPFVKKKGMLYQGVRERWSKLGIT